MKLYHSSNKRFSTFDLGTVGSGYGTLVYGPGIYLATRRGEASIYFGRYLYTVEMKDYRPLDLVNVVRPSDAAAFLKGLGFSKPAAMLEEQLDADFRRGITFGQLFGVIVDDVPRTAATARRLSVACEALGANCLFDSDALATTPNGLCVYDPALLEILDVATSSIGRALDAASKPERPRRKRIRA